MNQNSKQGREKFQLLLQQLQLTDDAIMSYFTNAEITKLFIERATKKWHFEFLLEKILPHEVYTLFSTNLVKTFSHIAQVTQTISVQNQEITQ